MGEGEPEGKSPNLPLRLELRIPSGIVYSAPVRSVVAEDLDGWFGIRPGRPDLLSVLPPGLLIFEDAEGEGYVANGGGVMNLESGRCRVTFTSAAISRSTEDLGEVMRRQRADLKKRGEDQAAVMDHLLTEAVRRAKQPAELAPSIAPLDRATSPHGGLEDA